MKQTFTLIACFLSMAPGFCQIQSDFSENPLDAKFVTSDVDRFYAALAKLETETNPFEAYIKNGSLGLKGFLEHRIYNADSLQKMVQLRKQEYVNGRDNLADLDDKVKRIRSAYAAMKYWYPEAIFPPIYFVVGRFNSGGTVSEAGIILGHEMQRDLEGLPALVSHELIHFQQKPEVTEENWTLLMSALHEGAADFIGELISGENINSSHYVFGEKHLNKLALEFVVSMDKKDNTDWLYGTSGKDHRPNDLGYWMGYKISEAYFNKTKDKKKAIYDMLHIANAKEFLNESGFLARHIEKVKNLTEQEKTALLTPFPKTEVTLTFKVTVPKESDEVFITGNHSNLGNWNPSAIKMNKSSAKEREITLTFDSPAAFKFTRGNWGSQALIKGIKGTPNLTYVKDETIPNYVVEGWTDEKN